MDAEEEEPLPGNLLLTTTMVTNGNAGEVSKKKTKMAEVGKKKNKSS